MKINKIISLSAAALLSIGAIGNTTYNTFAPQTVQAAKKATSKKAKTFKIKLKKNAKVFTKNGKRKGKKLLKKGQTYTVYGTKTIHGKKFYRISQNRYIKAINAKKLTLKTTNSSSPSTNTAPHFHTINPVTATSPSPTTGTTASVADTVTPPANNTTTKPDTTKPSTNTPTTSLAIKDFSVPYEATSDSVQQALQDNLINSENKDVTITLLTKIDTTKVGKIQAKAILHVDKQADRTVTFTVTVTAPSADDLFSHMTIMPLPDFKLGTNPAVITQLLNYSFPVAKGYRVKANFVKTPDTSKLGKTNYDVQVTITDPNGQTATKVVTMVVNIVPLHTDDGFEIAKVNPAYNAPVVENFDQSIIDQYHLEGHRWQKLTITYNTDEVDKDDLQYVNRVITQINNLHIVNLVPTDDKNAANIGISVEDGADQSDVGITGYNSFTGKTHKGLDADSKDHITIYSGRIRKWMGWTTTNDNYQSAFMTVTAHELGHALGLAHSEKTGDDIMATYSTTRRIDNDNDLLDEHYKQYLAVLYQN
ncbi:SLAP domain-containing protein (plasmid) [Lactobacillus sp. ESL0731]|uniref:SLAP domain-containing protein n=1 Tax=unclassified Lactobacillus TaxID=2620435 RepID=UPI0023F77E32|nr:MULTISPECIES: SLAP domain-containing protein [unclassified Lactobacillus]WEV52127.1 SLAP domain-containing protein [Lactobacillus sp. ESL0700]WEV63240.1 SLAP domain-containing protein [Lactobacillus sp. ESL0731]